MRESVVRALARVGLVWAVFVLGALFVLTGAHAPSGADDHAPRTVGLALTLLVLAGGGTVLAVGALRREEDDLP